MGHGGELLKIPLFAEIAQRQAKHLPLPSFAGTFKMAMCRSRAPPTQRMAANLDVFNFGLSSDERETIVQFKQPSRLRPPLSSLKWA
ncbi:MULTISPECIES: hypothetical protein [unclassified Pseudomonas]|uniref:hypothetical protein n=1 Tax=unclassified Pseudomonas TaxID=196821 RepID=UPI00215C4D3D|nr:MULTISPECIES: hypothetical protein [unclassified Pseudomonas]MCR8932225.1 hypothetical protein [Pseudomonas sp. S11A4]MCR8975835.1 hypothetical protein [Pseudomonas sp. S11P7]